MLTQMSASHDARQKSAKNMTYWVLFSPHIAINYE